MFLSQSVCLSASLSVCLCCDLYIIVCLSDLPLPLAVGVALALVVAPVRLCVSGATGGIGGGLGCDRRVFRAAVVIQPSLILFNQSQSISM